MKYFCIELNKSFDTLNEMHLALKSNAEKIISLKKAQIYKSHEKGQLSIKGAFVKIDEAVKAVLDMKTDYIYPVINTTNYMDSHMDVHFPGIWKKSLKDSEGQIMYVNDHQLSIDNVIAWKEDVRAYVKSIPWSLLGRNYEGKTEALIFEIEKSKLKKDSAVKAIDENRDVQNSVRMSYVRIKMGVNSMQKEFKEEKAYFDLMYPEIVNKEVVDELGYFWGVEEARIVKEGSLVLFGSNDVTPILMNDEEPEKSTQTDTEPSADTRKLLIFKNLI